MSKTKAKSPKSPAAEPARSQLPAKRPEPPLRDRPYRDLDRSLHAALARLTGGLSPHAIAEAWADWALHLSRAPGRQMELAEHAGRNAFELMSYAARATADATAEKPFKPRKYDHRFSHEDWNTLPFAFWQQGFLAVQDWWEEATQRLSGQRQDEADRTSFLARQALDTVSPSNFPWLNPEILAATLEARGKNLADGAVHFLQDAVQTATQAHKPAPEGYVIGKDLACTPGKVVYRNDIFELIQYAPQTDKVHPEPVLIIPAWIMKYYILDLSPHNSFIKYLVDQGFTVFAISWCNPTSDQADLSLEDYRKRGVMQAIDAVSAIVPERKIHANGYCLGGTMLAIAAATMARDGDDRLASVTLMAAQVDFTQAGELLLFLDESQVAFLEDMMWAQGYLDRPQMARTFAAIRAEDLIYSRAVNRYFLGKEDLPTDIGVWNGDTTRMPARMHAEYLRSLFLENRLTGGRFAVDGRVIALKDISAPMFVIGTETDHIAPWKSVYKARLFTECDLTFLLTKGGHNGGILSEPGHPRRHYRIGHRAPGDLYTGPDIWFEATQAQDGAWWPEYAHWLVSHSGSKVTPPSLGAPNSGYSPLEDAPGSYIHQT
ncbi:MAG: alpha/beta fold hydrolase [Rhodobacter sp.]|nr:alpha/beta fold hydrolase [Rhodobacter sp.]